MFGKSTNLSDWQQIHQILHLYPLVIDRKDWDNASLIFAEDVTADYNGVLAAGKGLDEIKAGMKEGTKGVSSQHHLGTTVINIAEDGKTANSTVYVVATMFKDPQENADQVAYLHGYYEDQLVKGADGWRIKKRMFSLQAPGLSGDLSVLGM